MNAHLFIFGRTPALAFLELLTFFPDATLLSEEIAQVEGEFPIDAHPLIYKLGGTVKIAKVVGQVDAITPETLVPFLDISSRVIFGVSGYGDAPKVARRFLDQMKKLLEASGVSSRFVESASGNTLSSVVVGKDHMQELVILKQGESYIVGKTIVVQPFEEWNKRDFDRPYADAKAGMLPLKASRMVVNIALQKGDMSAPRTQKTLLDPFCGMGTILSEALVMGWNVVGNDNDADVIKKTEANLRFTVQSKWAAEGVTFRLHNVDAVHMSENMDGALVDAIVTEPYMGKTSIASQQSRVSADDVKNIIKGLEKLYIGCLRDWQKVLKPQGIVVMALPMYMVGDKSYFVKRVIDMCETLGYTIQAGPIEYSRPQAVVKRLFYVFRKV